MNNDSIDLMTPSFLVVSLLLLIACWNSNSYVDLLSCLNFWLDAKYATHYSYRWSAQLLSSGVGCVLSESEVISKAALGCTRIKCDNLRMLQ